MLRIKRILCGGLCLALLLGLSLPVEAARDKEQPEYRLYASVYRNASASSTVIGKLEEGTEVSVLGLAGKFYRIDCYDMTGYIPTDRIEWKDGRSYVRCDGESEDCVYMPALPLREAMATRSRAVSVAMDQRGIRYLLGGATRSGFDCSGLVTYVMNKCGVSVGRVCMDLLAGGVIIPREALVYGDLVLFTGTGSSGLLATHVGIYIGNNQIVHSGTSTGVQVDSLSGSYFREHYLCTRRVIVIQQQKMSPVQTVESILTTTQDRRWVRTKQG